MLRSCLLRRRRLLLAASGGPARPPPGSAEHGSAPCRPCPVTAGRGTRTRLSPDRDVRAGGRCLIFRNVLEAAVVGLVEGVDEAEVPSVATVELVGFGRSGSSTPLRMSSPSLPKSWSSPSLPVRLSLPCPPAMRSLPSSPRSVSSPRSPKMASSSSPPRTSSAPPPPQIVSFPPRPSIVSSPRLPMMTSSAASPPMMITGPFSCEASRPTLDSRPLQDPPNVLPGGAPAIASPRRTPSWPERPRHGRRGAPT